MANYTFNYYTLSEIHKLEDSWHHLERGLDMTYFQSFSWYEMLWNLNKGINDSRFEIGFGCIERNGSAILIAPLWIVKRDFRKYNHKGFYIFGRGGWSDYLNFIYQEFDSNATLYMFSQLKERYGISNFFFENIQEESQLYKFLKGKCNESEVTHQICVGLSIKGLDIDGYKKILSKQSRQNIRTANNRLVKDGITINFDVNDCNINLEEFIEYRNVRVAKKNDWAGKNLRWKLINFISTKILRHGWYKFPDYAPYTHDSNSKFMTAKAFDGTLCASFNYGISSDERGIVLMGVSTNPAYSRYSPGILLLYHFIEKAINDKLFDYIDFTRGNESYKYALGGKEHIISNLKYEID